MTHEIGVNNIRVCCRECNQMRAAMGHCCGALMLAKIESAKRNAPFRETALLLGTMPFSRKMRKKDAKSGWSVAKVLDSDFVFPADTPAKRVWNMAVIASKH